MDLPGIVKSLSITDWFLFGLLALAVLLVLAGLLMTSAPRTEYRTGLGVGRAEAPRFEMPKHSQEDRQGSTHRLGPFPPRIFPASDVYPQTMGPHGEETIWKN